MFPGTVVSALDSPRLLVSGANNSKLGRIIRRGPWSGMPVFQLTLEERATCPESCPVWASCYGNAMHLARRHDAKDEDFVLALWAEVVTTYRSVMNQNTPPPGMVVRLHVLGDFYSARYVAVWADLLEKLPKLHVFGYTSRRPDRDDDASRETYRALEALTDAQWDRFAIRWSREAPVPQGAVVLDAPANDPDVIMCPAQTYKTASCSSCGLCWNEAARGKTIGFLRHGRKAAWSNVMKRSEQDRKTLPRPTRDLTGLSQAEIDFQVIWRRGRKSVLPTVGSPGWWRAVGYSEEP